MGPNGSGKSTVLQIISGLTLPSEGSVSYSVSGQELDPSKVYKDMVYTAPYVQLFEQFTLNEMIDIHKRFKQFQGNPSNAALIERMYLTDQKDQPIEVFSSGMKQRVKLALSIMSESKYLFLDEPLSNLDEKGKTWYADLVEEYKSDRCIVVCSNHQKEEYSFCDHIYNLDSNPQ